MRIEFTGSSKAYFKIWMVNLALSLLTLGIYSAWARVRSRRYFYSHTLVDGHSFDYHGDPLQVLKIHIALAAFVLVCVFASRFPPLFAIAAVMLAAGPWLWVRMLSFDAANTSYRGQRFDFDSDFKASYRTFGLGLLLTLISLGLLGIRWPLWLKRFAVPRLRYGQQLFAMEARTREYDLIFVKAIAMYLGLILVLGICGGGIGFMVRSWEVDNHTFDLAAGAVGVVVLYLSFALVLTYVNSQLMNFFWSRTRLGELRFESQCRTGELFLVYLQNVLACLFSLGLAYPWAAVNLVRYKASVFSIVKPDILAPGE